jgi:hypothetical protein
MALGINMVKIVNDLILSTLKDWWKENVVLRIKNVKIEINQALLGRRIVTFRL